METLFQKLLCHFWIEASAAGGSLQSKNSIEFFEGGAGETFLHKKVPPAFFPLLFPLLILPFRLAFFQECVDAFVRVVGFHEVCQIESFHSGEIFPDAAEEIVSDCLIRDA